MAANKLMDARDSQFLLFEQLGIQKLLGFKKFADCDENMIRETLDLADKVATEVLYQANIDGDVDGSVYDPKKQTVITPESYKEGIQAILESGFQLMTRPVEEGGIGMPEVAFRSALDFVTAGSLSLSMATTLGMGVYNLVRRHGNHMLKSQYLEKLLSGEWGGTMCLTENTAGSDVGSLKTKAVKKNDGSYSITGTKIFISYGDNDLFKNIAHAVLARIEGDPEGTKGISIFVVPKYRLNEDGSAGHFNNIVCSGIEHKMGLRSSPTCTLNFGDGGETIGYLLGEERQGMPIMFEMMNEARLDVGQQALSISSAAYHHALEYAKERVQGKNVQGDDATIVHHPDVARMLLWMKSTVESMRALTYLASMQIDLSEAGEGEERKEAKALLDFLIPIVKAGNTDNAWLVTGEAIQVFGGPHAFLTICTQPATALLYYPLTTPYKPVTRLRILTIPPPLP